MTARQHGVAFLFMGVKRGCIPKWESIRTTSEIRRSFPSNDDVARDPTGRHRVVRPRLRAFSFDRPPSRHHPTTSMVGAPKKQQTCCRCSHNPPRHSSQTTYTTPQASRLVLPPPHRPTPQLPPPLLSLTLPNTFSQQWISLRKCFATFPSWSRTTTKKAT